MQENHLVGSVQEIWRYPVKSMLGESLRCVDVETRGLHGDRIFAFRDRDTGKVASAKLPHKWKSLLTCRSTFSDRVNVIFPNGTEVGVEDAADLLSDMLGRRVDLLCDRPDGLQVDRADPDEVREEGSSKAVTYHAMSVGMGAPEGGFFDAMPIHFVTATSLAQVTDCSAASSAEAPRFRPNLVISTLGQAPFEENGWIGGTLKIGTTLRIAVLFPTPRCAVPGLRHGEIRPDPQIIHRIANLNKVPVLNIGEKPCLGAYGRVLASGRVSVGDTVEWMGA